MLESANKVNEQGKTGDKIKVIAEAIPKIVDGINSTAQTKSSVASINDKFPENFDIKDELKLDKEVYKYTGK